MVNFDKSAFVFVGKGCAGGAVGFVADNQIELFQAMLVLGAVNDVEE